VPSGLAGQHAGPRFMIAWVLIIQMVTLYGGRCIGQRGSVYAFDNHHRLVLGLVAHRVVGGMGRVGTVRSMRTVGVMRRADDPIEPRVSFL